MSFFNGIKFFDRNVANINLGGGATATSDSENAKEAFSGNFSLGWRSIGETNKNISIKRTFEGVAAGDTVYIANHNLKDVAFLINDSATEYEEKTVVYENKAYTALSFDYRADISSIRINCQNTITPDNEKSIGEILLLTTLGQFAQPQTIEASRPRQISDLELQDGKSFILKGGTSTVIKLKIFSLKQKDIDLFEKIQDFPGEFFIWPCGGNEDQFEYKFKPYRFRDLIKVAVASGNGPELKNNIYWSGLRDGITLKEVV